MTGSGARGTHSTVSDHSPPTACGGGRSTKRERYPALAWPRRKGKRAALTPLVKRAELSDATTESLAPSFAGRQRERMRHMPRRHRPRSRSLAGSKRSFRRKANASREIHFVGRPARRPSWTFKIGPRDQDTRERPPILAPLAEGGRGSTFLSARTRDALLKLEVLTMLHESTREQRRLGLQELSCRSSEEHRRVWVHRRLSARRGVFHLSMSILCDVYLC